ncbi:sulfur carrier protein ThiS [Thiomicrorhabdus aquaedulcis]|uniref:sulfur carrier protein ThiS n=1 Tax=Thiomicrorhabdus aquaedulcis TaxID=2211106 RepID=UPI001561E73F|nr:sulfur carrier protein ThiS [Thiomicrorhabdus aquaedulcis]
MHVLVNNQPVELGCDTQLSVALTHYGAQPPYAILLNDRFLPQSEHAHTQLTQGDRIDVICAIQGG